MHIDAILAWVQSHWSDKIYGVWEERDRQAGSGLQRWSTPSKQ